MPYYLKTPSGSLLPLAVGEQDPWLLGEDPWAVKLTPGSAIVDLNQVVVREYGPPKPKPKFKVGDHAKHVDEVVIVGLSGDVAWGFYYIVNLSVSSPPMVELYTIKRFDALYSKKESF